MAHDEQVSILITAKDAASRVFGAVGKNYERMRGAVAKAPVIGPVLSAVMMGVGLIPGLLTGLGGRVLKIARGTAAGVAKLIGSSVSTIAAGAAQVLSLARGVASALVGVATKTALAISAAVVGALAAITYQGVRFEREMAEVFTLIADQGQQAFGALSKGVIEIFSDLPTSLSGLTRGLYDTISSGITRAQDALTVLREVSRAAIAGVSDAGTMGSAFMTVMQSFGIAADKAKSISDSFFKTIEKGRLTARDLASGLGMVAGVAGTAGVKFKEMLGAIAAASRTLRPESVFVGLGQFLQSLIKPSDEAAKKMKGLGLSFFKAGKDGKQQFVGLLTSIREILKLKLDITEIAELFPEARAQRFVAALQAQRGEIESIFKAIGRSKGAADKAFELIFGTVGAQIRLAVNNLRAIGLQVWKAFSPAAVPALKEINSALKAMNKWLADILGSKTFDQWIKDAEKFLTNQAQRIVEFFTNLPAHIDAAKAKLAEWAAPLREAWDWLKQILDVIAQLVQKLQQTDWGAWAADIQKAVDELITKITGFAATVLQTLSNLLSTLYKGLEQLRTHFNLLIKGANALAKAGALAKKVGAEAKSAALQADLDKAGGLIDRIKAGKGDRAARREAISLLSNRGAMDREMKGKAAGSDRYLIAVLEAFRDVRGKELRGVQQSLAQIDQTLAGKAIPEIEDFAEGAAALRQEMDLAIARVRALGRPPEEGGEPEGGEPEPAPPPLPGPEAAPAAEEPGPRRRRTGTDVALEMGERIGAAGSPEVRQARAAEQMRQFQEKDRADREKAAQQMERMAEAAKEGLAAARERYEEMADKIVEVEAEVEALKAGKKLAQGAI